jgi:hypothetical protein
LALMFLLVWEGIYRRQTKRLAIPALALLILNDCDDHRYWCFRRSKPPIGSVTDDQSLKQGSSASVASHAVHASVLASDVLYGPIFAGWISQRNYVIFSFR